MEDFRALETVLGYTFQNRALLRTALTHSSFANECGQDVEHNERQEFLGDAVLEVCVSWELFSRFPKAREGDLTRLRAQLVSTRALADLAREMALDGCLLLGRGEESQGGRQRDTVLSDVLEAVLGAVFEDGGHEAAVRVVGHIFAGRWPGKIGTSPHKDFKTLLQEATQRLHKDRPVYVLQGSYGPEHAKEFEVRLELPNGQSFTAAGPSLKRAEQEAARLALELCRAMEENAGSDRGQGPPC